MSKFIPDYVFDSIYDITPEILQSHGIRAALIDLDGTMVSHKTALPTEEVAAFLRRLEGNGIHVVVFSNNNANRVGTFCEPLGVDFISRAHKPFARAYAQAVEKLGLPIDQIAVIGDQIYTDVFGGNRAGALTCYVETLDRRFFWINVRYQLERGFIARGRRRMEARAHHALPEIPSPSQPPASRKARTRPHGSRRWALPPSSISAAAACAAARRPR